MRIPLSWLKDYIKTDLSPDEIAQKLTLAGLEVDAVETIGERFAGVIVAKVVTAEKHPQADRLSVATVFDGKDEHQVVCAAPNCRTGLITAFAPIGTTLIDDQGSFTIKKSRLRGVDSYGMLCAGKELGLSEDADGIMEIETQAPLGTPLTSFLGDTFFEISLTPNLGHCSSVFGVARELAAIIGASLNTPEITLQESKEAISSHLKVNILDKEWCPRYASRMIKGVRVGPSPDWLKARIEKAGLRSINNVVDITNYVLLEFGHPLHAFDYDHIDGHVLNVRLANDGESIQTLDGKERALLPSHLVICDAKKPLALAGVMGGQNSEVTDQTTTIVLEAAYFNPVVVRRASKQLGLYTDAAKRFEKGTDPNQLLQSLDRAAMLIQMVAGGEILHGTIDIQTKDFPEKHLVCRVGRTNELLGTNLGLGEIEELFKRLGFRTRRHDEVEIHVTVPTYRVDIKEEIDLIEEVARLYGFDNIKKAAGKSHPSAIPDAPIYLFENIVRNRLVSEGLQEFLTCDLIGPTLLQIVQEKDMPPESSIHVVNPTSVEQSILRTSLLPGLLHVIKHNADHQIRNISGFEIGKIHFKDGSNYKEQSMVGIILTGQTLPPSWGAAAHEVDFFDLKGIVENLLNMLGIHSTVFKNIGLEAFHSGRQASLFIGELEIGSMGEIHPAIQRRLDVPHRILFAEFSLQDLIKLAAPLAKVTSLPLYPGSERDWTFTISTSISFDEVLRAIQKELYPLLERVELVALFQSEKIGIGLHNMTLRFHYRDLAKTLSKETVEEVHGKIVQEAISKLQLTGGIHA